jgi:arylsulfatase A-like enzyme
MAPINVVLSQFHISTLPAENVFVVAQSKQDQVMNRMKWCFVSGSCVLAVIAGLCVPVAGASEGRADKAPNFVVILVDDLGYMDIGANNPHCFYETPNIDGLAASGTRFTNGYAANPVCSPTRYSLVTGKYPTRVRATNFFSGKRGGRFQPAPLNNNMPLDEITIAQALKEKGYATFFAGKWHLGSSEEYYPQNRGFDVNIGGYHRGGPYSGKRYFAPFENPQIKVESPAGEHLPARLARETAGFIDANKDKPFLAYLAFYSVHTPLMGRPDLVEKYKKKAAAVVGEEFADEEQIFSDKPRNVRILQKHAVYAAMVEAMDQAVGKVLQQLEASGVADNTVVLLTSDNGGLSTSEGSPTSNLPLRGGKGWVYEGGIREPWIVRYPGVTTAGTECAEPICSIDLFPTVAAAAGVNIKHHIDGIDIRPALSGKTLNRKSLFWHYPHYSNQGGIPGGAIREGDFKLIERYEDGRVHLYDLAADIGETNDLAAAMPERVKQMRSRLHKWYQSVDAQFLQPKDGQMPWRPAYAK